MKKNDKILIGVLLLIAVALLAGGYFLKQNTKNGVAVVLVDGKVFGRYPLLVDRTVRIPWENGTNVLTIQDGEVYMSEAACPDKLCMGFGKKRYNTETIVCRPGGILVIIENGEDSPVDVIGQ